MVSIYTKVFLSIVMLLILSNNKALHASHILGGDMEVECLGNDLYEITLTMQWDCNSTLHRTDKTITITSPDGGCSFSQDIEMTGVDSIIVDAEDITPVCGVQCTQCDSMICSFSYGMRKLVYKGTVDLSDLSNPNCCSFDITFDGSSNCCRSHSIDNITRSGNSSYPFTAQINTCLSQCPSTPKYSRNPVAIVCRDQMVTYNQGVTVPAGDDVHFQFITPAGITSDRFVPPFTPQEPISFNENFGFNLDPNTGDLTFIPDTVMTGIFTIEAVQTRNGTHVSTTSRELQVVVIDCDNNPPDINAVFQHQVCENQSISIPVMATDPDMGVVSLTWNEGINGAQFDSSSGSPSTSSTFHWTPGVGDAGNRNFIVEAKDDGCPLSRVSSRAISIEVIPSSKFEINGPKEVCVMGTSVYNTAYEPSILNYWQVEGGTITENNDHNIEVEWGKAGNAFVRLTQVHTETGCTQSDTLFVKIEPISSSGIIGPNLVCENSRSHEYSISDENGHIYDWQVSGGEILEENKNQVLVHWTSKMGLISVIKTNTELNCFSESKLFTSIIEIPQITINPDENGPYCPEERSILNVTEVEPDNGFGIWSGPAVVNDSFFDASLTGRGSHTLTYTHTLENGCVSSEDVDVTVIEEPSRTELFNVSFEEDFETIFIDWTANVPEEFFGEYRIYRQTPDERHLQIHTESNFENTYYYDDFSSIDHEYICYYVRTYNYCGEKSEMSYHGCPVLPESEPEPLINHISWVAYEYWPIPIEKHIIRRINEGGQTEFVIQTSADTTTYSELLTEDHSYNSYCYFIETYAEDGRMSRSALTCTEQPALVFLPNSFSPGVTPGLNDTFGPHGMHISTYEMTIFNRWGQIVYETSEADPWDGTTKDGEFAKIGNYIYYVTVFGYNDEPVTFKGSVTIVR